MFYQITEKTPDGDTLIDARDCRGEAIAVIMDRLVDNQWQGGYFDQNGWHSDCKRYHLEMEECDEP